MLIEVSQSLLGADRVVCPFYNTVYSDSDTVCMQSVLFYEKEGYYCVNRRRNI